MGYCLPVGFGAVAKDPAIFDNGITLGVSSAACKGQILINQPAVRPIRIRCRRSAGPRADHDLEELGGRRPTGIIYPDHNVVEAHLITGRSPGDQAGGRINDHAGRGHIQQIGKSGTFRIIGLNIIGIGQLLLGI